MMGFSEELGVLLAKFELDANQFHSEIGKVTEETLNWEKVANIGVAACAALGVAIIATAATLTKFATDLADSTMELEKMSLKTGMPIDRLQELSHVAAAADMDIGQMQVGFNFLSRAMENNSDVFKKAGIAFTDIHGKMLPLNTVLMNVADKFKSMPDGPEKAAMAIELFGRSGTALIPILNRGSEGITELSGEAHKMGLVMDEESTQATLTLKGHIQELHETSRGYSTMIGELFVPALNNLYDAEFKDGNVSFFLADAIITVTKYVSEATLAIPMLANRLESWYASAMSVYEGVEAKVAGWFKEDKFVAQHKKSQDDWNNWHKELNANMDVLENNFASKTAKIEETGAKLRAALAGQPQTAAKGGTGGGTPKDKEGKTEKSELEKSLEETEKQIDATLLKTKSEVDQLDAEYMKRNNVLAKAHQAGLLSDEKFATDRLKNTAWFNAESKKLDDKHKKDVDTANKNLEASEKALADAEERIHKERAANIMAYGNIVVGAMQGAIDDMISGQEAAGPALAKAAGKMLSGIVQKWGETLMLQGAFTIASSLWPTNPAGLAFGATQLAEGAALELAAAAMGALGSSIGNKGAAPGSSAANPEYTAQAAPGAQGQPNKKSSNIVVNMGGGRITKDEVIELVHGLNTAYHDNVQIEFAR
jgi:hypothetical protein